MLLELWGNLDLIGLKDLKVQTNSIGCRTLW